MFTRNRSIGIGLVALLFAAVFAGLLNTASAATGSIFVANEWSKVTDETNPPFSYTTFPDVYSTYPDFGRLIQPDSDLVRVVVVDGGRTSLVQTVVTDSANITVSSGGDGDDTITGVPGSSALIRLTGLADTLIAGSLTDVQASMVISTDGGATNLLDTELTITNFFAGSHDDDPFVVLFVSVAGPFHINYIEYETSSVDVATVRIKSDLEPVGVTVLAQETGIDSGRFEGFVRLQPFGGVTANGLIPDLTSAPDPATAGFIRTTAGPVVIEYEDSDGVTRSTSVLVDTSPPHSTITSPASGSTTQNQRPTFSGTIDDTGAGIDIGEITVAFDGSDDPTNAALVINPDTGVLTNFATDLGVSTAGALDGDLTFAFSTAPSFDLPPGTTVPDHIIDWVIVASDLAGNLGISDVDPSTNGIQLPTVKIDKVVPTFTSTFTDHRTGLGLVGGLEVEDRNSIRVAFNDQLMASFVDASDFLVTFDSGVQATPIKATVDNDPDLFQLVKPLSSAARSVVYLEIDPSVDFASDETPSVELQGIVSDLAGNAISVGTTVVVDGIGPLITLTTSGGSGTGTGDEGPGGLTNSQMTLEITSDEPLSGAPFVEVFRVNDPFTEVTPVAVSSGVNSWVATYTAPGATLDGLRAVKVIGIDLSANRSVVGTSNTPTFRVDRSVATPMITVGPGDATTVLSSKPTLTLNFALTGEQSSITISEAFIDGVLMTDTFAPVQDDRVLSVTLTTPLADGDHTFSIPALSIADAAGNLRPVDTTLTFTVDSTNLLGFSLSPAASTVRADVATTVTVSVDDLGAITPDELQINFAFDDEMFFMQNPQCIGAFDGGTASAITREADDLSSYFTCSIPGGAVSRTGDVASFELVRLEAGTPTLNLRLDGSAPTQVAASGFVTGVPESPPTFEVLFGFNCPADAYDADFNGFISRTEAIEAVTDFFLARVGPFGELLTRDDAVQIVTFYLLGSALTCSSQ